MVRIFLTGYMGAGKTTLGKAFARKMNVPFVDLDWYIEERFHKTVGELFTERGETGFRELERNMLHEVSEFENVVISTGGGAPCFFDNMEFMNRVGKTVFLDVHPDVLFRRLRIAKQQRPILQGKEDDELKAFIIRASYPEIKPVEVNIADYDRIIVGAPLWWSNMAAPLQTFLFQYGSLMEGKSIGLIVSSSSSGISGVESDARRLIPGGDFLEPSLWIRSGQTSNCHSMIADWLSQIN